MPHSDQKYITALVNNDEVLINELYEKFSGKIRWMVMQNNGTETDAADIFQDALVSIYNKAKTQNFILTCPLEAFLHLICRNKWINELSKRKTHNVTSGDTDAYHYLGEDDFKLAEECRLHEDRKNLLMKKLRELSDSCQKLLHLSWSNKSMEEVADVLNVSYGYVRKRKSECMAKLVALVKESSQFKSLKR